MDSTPETNQATARAATLLRQLDLGRIALIGTFGPESDLTALLRMPSGRLRRVELGDRLRGAQIAGIAPGIVVFNRGPTTETLRMAHIAMSENNRAAS